MDKSNPKTAGRLWTKPIGRAFLAILIGIYGQFAIAALVLLIPNSPDHIGAIGELGIKVSHILVSELRNDTFFARIVIDVDGDSMEIDSRPSDAIALAVRVGAPIFVSEQVMGLASITPEEEITPETEATTSQEAEDLAVFRDFVESLDLDDLGDN